MVDPFENIYDYDVTVGGQEGKGHTFLNMNGSSTTIDGPVMLDAHCYNITIWGGTNNNIRDVKILSTFMTSDGISTGSSSSKFEHCFIYNGCRFELDVYPFSDDKAVLFMYAGGADADVPPEIRIIREVTGDPAYKNRQLAHVQAL